MRLKNTLIAMVVLLASGATVSFAQESHIGNLQGRASAGIASGVTARRATGAAKTQPGSTPSRETSQPLRLSAVRRPLAHYQPIRIFSIRSLVGS